MLGINQITNKVPHFHHKALDVCDHGAELNLGEELVDQVVKFFQRGDLLLGGDDELRLLGLGLVLGVFAECEVAGEDLGHELLVLV
jgi:hypothetical protein